LIPAPRGRLLFLYILVVASLGLLTIIPTAMAQPVITEFEPHHIFIGERLTVQVEGFTNETLDEGDLVVTIGGVQQKLVLEDMKADDNDGFEIILEEVHKDTPDGEQTMEVVMGGESATMLLEIHKEPGSNRNALFIATAIFLGVYIILITEKLHRTTLAMIGAAVMVVTLLATGMVEGADTLHFVIEKVDWNTIGLLLGMMVIVGVLMETGVFQFVGLYAAQYAKGDYWKIMLLFCTFTGVASAFLDNVTTILLMVPVTISICKTLEFRPMPLIIAQVLASNVGGAATLIGDPPNIIIGSGAGITFNEFAIHMVGPVIVSFIVSIYLLKFLFRKDLDQQPKHLDRIMELDPWDEITDMKTLKQALFVLGATIFGFVIHGVFHLEPSVIALIGASALLVISRMEVDKAFHHVEWPTLMFFAGLFIIVGGVEEVGLIHMMAKAALDITGGNLWVAMVVIVLIAAIASAFVDNIPFTATMVPLIITMSADPAFAESTGEYSINPLWWALALGADFGGNGTLVGASANVVAAGVAERQGFPISFNEFMKKGFPFMLITVFVGMAVLLLMMKYVFIHL